MYVFVFVAAAVAVTFAAAAVQRPRPGVIVAAILWMAYAVYEYFVASGVLCDANCNIRVDLILLWPLLAFATWYACDTPRQRSVVNKALGVIAVLVVVSLVAPLAYFFFMEMPPAVPSAGSASEGK
jgi:hypothetical protein